MILFPTLLKSAETEESGVELVREQLRDLGQIFRSKTRKDIGIDGEIELIRKNGDNRQGTGRLIAVQIKAGASFFKNQVGEAFLYRGENKHLGYWLDHSIPVLVLLCDLASRKIHWVEVTPGAVTRHPKSWTILVPKTNVLANSEWQLTQIGERNRIDNVIDLCVRAWLHTSRPERVEFCGIMAMPRDYHWYKHLVKIGDRQIMLHWLYARYGLFDLSELADALQHLKGNAIYGEELILCLVAEAKDAFVFGKEWRDLCAAHDNLRTVQLVFDRDWPEVAELTESGELISEYYQGRPI